MGQISNKTIMAQNIAKYLKIKGIKPADLSRVLDVPYTTVYDWVNGRTYPRIDKIQPLNTLSNLLWFGCAAISARI